MTDISVDLIWREGMTFEANLDGHKMVIDSDQEMGGNNRGPRPKKLILVALAACTGMDVVSILKKMRVTFTHFDVKVHTRQTEEHPMVYIDFEIIYQVSGSKPEDNHHIEKAIKLSQEKYCGVSAMLAKVGEVRYRIEIL